MMSPGAFPRSIWNGTQRRPVLILLPQGWTSEREADNNRSAPGVFARSPEGVLHYVKAHSSLEGARREALALALYRECGVLAPRAFALVLPDGTPAVASEAIEGVAASEAACFDDARWTDGIPADLWLGNYDASAVEEADDGRGLCVNNLCINTVVDPAGAIHRIDAGDAFSPVEIAHGNDRLTAGSAVVAAFASLTHRRLVEIALEVGLSAIEAEARADYLVGRASTISAGAGLRQAA